ncbi:MAG: hypothetical protein J0H63_09350 [Rhizobiales bacterium]|nr:hypothetical protein [Hyphomicrobiales bacterium]MBN9010318.1 hypothetical protein [Hyphomicrobiales bacterium]
MIIGPDFVWLHLPKAAGTETEAVLRGAAGNDKRIAFDPIDLDNVIWHHSIRERMDYDPRFRPAGRRILCNLRRLPFWVISWTEFCYRLFPHNKPTREMFVAGRLFEWDGSISVPDDYARKYNTPEVDTWIRSEFLAKDLAREFAGWFGWRRSPKDFMAQRNKGTAIRFDIGFYFTPAELKDLYRRNPLWSALEESVYGDLIEL